MDGVDYLERRDMLRDYWREEIERWKRASYPIDIATYYDGGARMAAELLQANAAVEGEDTSPDFIVEALASQFHNGTDLKAWVNQQQAAAKAQGCTFFRATSDLNAVGHAIVEGWTVKPDPLPPIAWKDESTVKQSVSSTHHG